MRVVEARRKRVLTRAADASAPRYLSIRCHAMRAMRADAAHRAVYALLGAKTLWPSGAMKTA